MTFVGNKILLGYVDEQVFEQEFGMIDRVDFKTNKLGGKPNWMFSVPDTVKCALCGLPSPLILQIYAPITNSLNQRTLYIFACINSSCWNKSESWVCLRSQQSPARNSEKKSDGKKWSWAAYEAKVYGNKVFEPPSSWSSGSDMWGDDDSGCQLDYLNDFTQNTYDFSNVSKNVSELNRGISEMTVEEKESKEELDLNKMNLNSVPPAFAMIEGGEGDMVCIDTPILPTNDLSALLHNNSTLPSIPESGFEFVPFYIYVDEEDLTRVGLSEEDIILAKIRDYRASQEHEGDMMTTCGGGESYEKSLPPHGDKMFHRFLTRINANPGHVIRYSGYPLWLYPSEQMQFRCHYCGGESAFEIQILPTIIPKLFLRGSTQSGGLEFGSVFVFSCLAGCWDPRQQQLRLENIVVQKEKM